MNRSDRDRAQRISEYVDGLVVHRREERLRPFSAEDDEFRELVELARTLNGIELRPPGGFQDGLADELARSIVTENRAGWVLTANWSALARHWARSIARFPSEMATFRVAAVVAVIAAAVVVFVPHIANPPTVSAAEVLTRADRALAKLVRPGQILYRRWKVVARTTLDDGRTTVSESTVHEWMDGADFGRVAGRNERDGAVYLAYASVREKGEIRPRVYFAPGFSGEPKGLLSIEPSRREFQEALSAFEPGERAKLQTYLERGYIFEPISGERRFNRLALETSTRHGGPLPRVMVSLEEETLPTGRPVYAVRIFDPARVRFRWTSVGSPVAWLEQRDTVRYIARDTNLSLRSEERFKTEDGRSVFATRELLETRIIEAAADTSNPFLLTVPEGTPVRYQSALEQLTAVSRALRNVPALTLSEDRLRACRPELIGDCMLGSEELRTAVSMGESE